MLIFSPKKTIFKLFFYLILLILRDEIVEVGLCLCELHVVHALSGVPVQEGLATEHRRELLGDALEELLYVRAGWLFSDVARFNNSMISNFFTQNYTWA